MDTRLWIGLDLGTTATKACAFNAEGKLVAMSSMAYQLRAPEPLAAILEPVEVLAAAEAALLELRQKTTCTWAAIGLSTAMHTVLLLDEAYQPISPMYTYADGRSMAVMGQFSEEQMHELNQYTGTPVHPMSPLLKLIWLQKKKRTLWAATVYFSDIKSYLLHRWTNAGLQLDYSLASATGLFSLEAKDWYLPALATAGVRRQQLPQLVPVITTYNWRSEVGQRLGIESVPLTIGGSDGCLANLGSGLLQPGEAAMTVGTSGAVRITHQAGPISGVDTLFNYHLHEDYLVCGGATNNGGKTLEWAFQTFQHGCKSIGEMIEKALALPPVDIQFTPYLYGERAPIWDANASATLIGLRGQHSGLHLCRAVIEGMTDNLIVILRQLEAATGPVKKIHLSGGLAQNASWQTLVAEKSGRELILAETEQASAKGAALLARLATQGNEIVDLVEGWGAKL